jgi:hypothetical protein
MNDAFDTAQAEYDAAEPPEWCPHDGRLTPFTGYDGSRYLICQDCGEYLLDLEEEDSCATYS